MTPKEAANILRSVKRIGLGATPEALDMAIEALDPWVPPVAIIPWVDVKDHPHPLNVRILYKTDSVYTGTPHNSFIDITHWCLLPKDDNA